MSNYWHPEIPKGGPKLLDSMVLSTGQVFLIFAVLIVASIVSTSTLLGELCYHSYKNRKDQDFTKPFFEKLAETSKIPMVKNPNKKKTLIGIKI